MRIRTEYQPRVNTRTLIPLKVRRMMGVVAIAALLLGVQVTRSRWADYRRKAAYHASCALLRAAGRPTI